MNITAYNNLRKSLYNALCERRLLDAIIVLEKLAKFVGQPSTSEAAYALRQNYAMLLNYMKSGLDDFDRESYFSEFLRRAYRLSDALCREFTLNHIPCTEKMVYDRIHLSPEAVADTYIPFVEGSQGRPATIAEILADPLASYQQIFDTVWTSAHWTAAQREELVQYVLCDDNPLTNRLSLVSAAGLAVLFSFDEEKCLFLLGAIEENQVKVSVRALVMLLLIFSIYRSRIELYPTIVLKFNLLSELTYFHPLFVEVQKIMLVALESPKLAKKVDEELPESILSAHEQMKELPQEATDEDIEQYIEEHPNARKLHRKMIDSMHEFVMMQEKGVDVSFHSFAHLLSLVPFFEEVANWFCPFSFDHPLLFNVNTAARFLSIITQNKACDTERFAIVMSMAPHLPEIRIVKQDSLTMEETQFEGDDAENFMEEFLEAMAHKDADGGESLLTIKPELLRRHVVCNVQDCFRFFKLFDHQHSNGNEMVGDDGDDDSADSMRRPYVLRRNPFDKDICFWLDKHFENIFAPDDVKRDLANWLFELEDYEGAVTLYRSLPDDADMLQRRAYAYEQLDLPKVAQEDYCAALELEPDNEWIKQQLVASYRNCSYYVAAAELLEELTDAKPDDIRYTRQLAELYIRMNEYERAKQLYTKMHYLRPHHIPTLRALAWCCMALGECDKAAKHYLVLLEDPNPLPDDYQNAGHCALLQKDIPSALFFYQEYIRAKGEEFAPSTLFHEDRIFLIERGIDLTTQRLVIDLLNL